MLLTNQLLKTFKLNELELGVKTQRLTLSRTNISLDLIWTGVIISCTSSGGILQLRSFINIGSYV